MKTMDKIFGDHIPRTQNNSFVHMFYITIPETFLWISSHRAVSQIISNERFFWGRKNFRKDRSVIR